MAFYFSKAERRARAKRQEAFESELKKARLKEAREEARQKARLERQKKVGIARARAEKRVAYARRGIGGGITFGEFVGLKKTPKIRPLAPMKKKVKKKRKRVKVQRGNGGLFFELD